MVSLPRDSIPLSVTPVRARFSQGNCLASGSKAWLLIVESFARVRGVDIDGIGVLSDRHGENIFRRSAKAFGSAGGTLGTVAT